MRVRLFAGAAVKPAEAQVAGRDQRTHPEFVGQREACR